MPLQIEFNQVTNNFKEQATTKQIKMSASNVRASGLTRNQEAQFRTAMGDDAVANALLARLASPVIQAPASRAPSNVNNTTPSFTAQPDWNKTVNGVQVPLLTSDVVKDFFVKELGLAAKHINILREEGITHPIDFAQFDSEDFDSVIKSVKGLNVPLPGLSQILLKQACDYIQFLVSTGREIKDDYLKRGSIKNHAMQFKALKEAKDGLSGLPKLGKSTDVLGWLDRVEKSLRQLLGSDYTPLLYVILSMNGHAATDDLISGKCYSVTHGSLTEELVNRKLHTSNCLEADKVILYDLLDRALANGPLESALQAHEDTKDGQAVMRSIIKQHGGTAKWEKAHASLVVASKKTWKSTGSITLTEHIASFRVTMSKITKACKHTTNTPPTSREQVLTLLASIETTESLLQAHIAQINGDPNGKGSDFEETATHLMLADPVEKHKSKQTKKVTISSSLAGRGTTGVDLRWYPNAEFKKLSDDQRNELMEWRKTPEGESAMKRSLEEARKKRKNNSNGGGRGGGGNNDTPSKKKRRIQKFENAVAKAAEAKVAAACASYEEEEQGDAKFDASLVSAIERMTQTDSTSSSPKPDKKAKLASIVTRLGKKKQ